MAKTNGKSYLPAKSGPRVVPWLWINDQWHEKLPAIFELLAAGIYEGEERKPATITFFVSEGRLKCCIRDRQTRQNAWMTLEAEGDIFAEVEALIVAGKAEWRSDKKGDGVEAVF